MASGQKKRATSNCTGKNQETDARWPAPNEKPVFILTIREQFRSKKISLPVF
jgi:hypothetical protein